MEDELERKDLDLLSGLRDLLREVNKGVFDVEGGLIKVLLDGGNEFAKLRLLGE